MAFKMKKFSGFKSVGENIKKISKKAATKVAAGEIKKQLVKKGLKTMARTIPMVSAVTTAYSVGKFADKINPEGNTVTRLKKDRKNNPNLGRKL